MRFFLTFLLMFGFWILLSGYFDAFHIISGIISSMLVAYFSHDLLISKEVNVKLEARRIVRFFLYLPWLLKEIVTANIYVAYRVLHPRMPIEPTFVTVKTKIRTEMGIVTLANSVTLTPGTVTIAANQDGEFLIHAITKEAADTLREGEMARRVERIEGEHV